MSSTTEVRIPVLSDRLDDMESKLPGPARAGLRLQRAIAQRGIAASRSAIGTVRDASKVAGRRAASSAKTVWGTARSASDKITDTATTETKKVAGQASAQAKRVVRTAKAQGAEVAGEGRTAMADAIDATESMLDSVAGRIESVEPKSTDYEKWSKDELYDKAQELDIAGRSTMSKDELIGALRSASVPA